MKKFILLLLGLQCCLYNNCLAQDPGDLHGGFNGGIVTLPDAQWFDVAVQPDGKVLTVGNIIARYNVNGTLDGTFGVNGLDTIEVNNDLYYCSAVGIQPDGKILVAGGSAYYASQYEFLLIRFHPNGGLDSTFDGDGISGVDFGTLSVDLGYELAIQQDGKIVVAGVSDGYLALARLNSNGSIDSTFDNDGRSVFGAISVATNSFYHETYMKLQTDGKILVGSANMLARLNTDGSFDNSFGSSGMVSISEWMSDLAIQPDGKIVWAGGDLCYLVVRLEADGSADNSFGSGGTANICAAEGVVTSLALQADGRILLGGYTTAGVLNNYRDFMLTRINYDGSVDSSFGSNGQVVTSMSVDWRSESHASVITPDQNIVLAGHAVLEERAFLVKYYLGWPVWPAEAGTVYANIEHFVVAPNPASDAVNIDASGVENGVWQLELRDVTGRQLLQEDVVVTNGSIQKNVSLNDLPEGLYMLQLDNGKTKTVSKLVKVGN